MAKFEYIFIGVVAQLSSMRFQIICAWHTIYSWCELGADVVMKIHVNLYQTRSVPVLNNEGGYWPNEDDEELWMELSRYPA